MQRKKRKTEARKQRWAGKETERMSTSKPVHDRSQHHYSQQPISGHNPSVHRWITKCGPATVEHYSARKRGGALTLTTTWKDLENMTLSEKSQTPKATYCVIPYMKYPK